MDKSLLRKHYKEKRKILKNRGELSSRILQRLLDNFELKGKVVSVFIPIDKLNEINTWPLIESLQSNDVFYCVPRADFEQKALHHFLYEGKEQLELSDWGIYEPINGTGYSPKEFDIVLVPLLAYDLNGNRVGYGGGFYDRFLANCKPKVLKIGLSYFPPEKKIETNADDISLDYCVTPTHLYAFG
jgi:5-formyltetrahydrofolate cyclo-ligase